MANSSKQQRRYLAPSRTDITAAGLAFARACNSLRQRGWHRLPDGRHPAACPDIAQAVIPCLLPPQLSASRSRMRFSGLTANHQEAQIGTFQ